MSKQKQLFTSIRNSLIAGLIVVIPIVLTVGLGIYLYTLVTSWSIAAIETYHLLPLNRDGKVPFLIAQAVRLASIMFIFLIVLFIGAVTKYTLGQHIIKLTEKIMLKLPIIRTIYSTIQQIGNAIWAQNGGMFSEVVLFEYPRKGIYVIGFLTNDNKSDDEWELKQKTEEELYSVFLPTTPNPTSGFLLFVPKEDCTVLDMDVTEAMRLIISGGAVTKSPGNKIDE
jgi:uncharacterized membrane protein